MQLAIISLFVLLSSCNNNSETKNTHQHDDGSTHIDHDTTKPVQQEFNVTDTIKNDTSSHSHDDGNKHSH
jgi:hypothetical protein